MAGVCNASALMTTMLGNTDSSSLFQYCNQLFRPRLSVDEHSASGAVLADKKHEYPFLGLVVTSMHRKAPYGVLSIVRSL